MSKLKLIKKILIEVFQWLAFAIPVFVTGQRYATVDCATENNCTGDGDEGYWLLVAGVIAYVAGITLVVWLPLKIFIVWKKVFRPFEGLWVPGNSLYILFSAVPCVALIILGHQRCEDHFNSDCFDYFRGAPIDTFVVMLVVTDWSEKIKCMKLRSQDDSMWTHKHTSSTSDPHQPSVGINGEANVAGLDTVNISQTPLQRPSKRNETFRKRLMRNMKQTDARYESLLRDLLLAFDTRTLLGLSLLSTGDGGFVFKTSWLYPIYIFAVISFLPHVCSPKSNMRPCLTVFLQDIPFFIFRVAIFSFFGSELVLSTSVLFLFKNFFVAFAFCYFNLVVPKISDKLKQHKYDLRRLSEKPASTTPNGLAGNTQDKGDDPQTNDRNQNDVAIGGRTNPDFDGNSTEISSL